MLASQLRIVATRAGVTSFDLASFFRDPVKAHDTLQQLAQTNNAEVILLCNKFLGLATQEGLWRGELLAVPAYTREAPPPFLQPTPAPTSPPDASGPASSVGTRPPKKYTGGVR
jgi:hypothetical protein